jgi:hypothetical protein
MKRATDDSGRVGAAEIARGKPTVTKFPLATVDAKPHRRAFPDDAEAERRIRGHGPSSGAETRNSSAPYFSIIGSLGILFACRLSQGGTEFLHGLGREPLFGPGAGYQASETLSRIPRMKPQF